MMIYTKLSNFAFIVYFNIKKYNICFCFCFLAQRLEVISFSTFFSWHDSPFTDIDFIYTVIQWWIWWYTYWNYNIVYFFQNLFSCSVLIQFRWKCMIGVERYQHSLLYTFTITYIHIIVCSQLCFLSRP